MTDVERALAALTMEQLSKREAALSSYQMSLWRINEQSNAADREELRVIKALSLLRAEIQRREKAP